MRMTSILAVLLAGAVCLGLIEPQYVFAGLPLPALATLVAAIAMVYTVTFKTGP